MDKNTMSCPVCNANDLTLKREAKYVYSYQIDDDAPGLSNFERFYSFQYDQREQVEGKSYLECQNCGQQISCQVRPRGNGITIELADLQID